MTTTQHKEANHVNTPIINIDRIDIHLPSPGTLLSSIEQIGAAVATVHAPETADAPEGTVVDHATGLMWSKATTATDKTWKQAKKAAADVRLGGFTDWRLPTRAELLTLVDDTRSNPAIDTDKFECEASWYWSSTPLASSPSDCAWVVNFDDGDAVCSSQSIQGRVRAVRSVVPSASGQ